MFLGIDRARETAAGESGRKRSEGDRNMAAREAAGREIPAAAYRVIPRADRIFQRELKPQSAMEAGLGMRWQAGWEFGDDEGERTWRE